MTTGADESVRPHPIDAEGTDESVWRDWADLGALPAFDLSGVRSVLVVAPHPDDEVLGFGGGIALLAAGGARLHVLAVTDGDASHPDSPTLSRGALVRRRHDERTAALRELGAEDAELSRLSIPDGSVGAAEAEVATRVNALCEGVDLCVAPWSGDQHPDHDATGRAAEAAAAAAGTPLVRYPVWMWHWARPDHPDVPWNDARRIALPEHVRRRKAAAVGRFTTQIAPLSGDPRDRAILSAEMLAHFDRDAETVFA